MSLEIDGVWKTGVWATTAWASGVWFEGQGVPVAPSSSAGSGKFRKKKLDWSIEEILAYVDAVNSRLEKPVDAIAQPLVVEEAIPATPAVTEIISQVQEIREGKKFRDAQVRLAMLGSLADRLERTIEQEMARRASERLQAEEDEAIEFLMMN